MTLRRKTALILGLAAVLIGTVALIFSKLILQTGFNTLEEEHCRREIKTALKLLQVEIDDLDRKNIEWSAWDNTCEFVASADEKCINNVLVTDTYRNLDLNIMAFTDLTGKILFGGYYTPAIDKVSKLPSNIDDFLSKNSSLSRLEKKTDCRRGLVIIDTKPFILSSRPILNTGKAGPVRGALIAGRAVDDKLLRRISKNSRLSLEVCPANCRSIPEGIRATLIGSNSDGAMVISKIRADIFSGFSIMRDIFGKAAIIVRTDIPREIHAEGEKAAQVMIFSVIGMALFFISAGMVLVDKLVLSRLTSLTSEVRSLGEKETSQSKRITTAGSDEITELAMNINTMIDSIDRAHKLESEREKYYSHLFHNSHVPMILVEPGTGGISDANQAACDFYGYGQDRLRKLNINDLMAGHSFETHRVVNATGHEKRDLIEARQVMADGEVRDVEIQYGPIKMGSDNILIYFIIHDISRHKQIEETISEQHQQLTTIFDGINQPVYVSDPDSYEILYGNRHAREQWGEIVGKTCYKVLQQLDEPCPFCSNKQIFGKNAGESYIWEFQNKVNKRWYCCVDKAIRWPDGRLVRSEIALDIHDRKMAEEALRLDEARLEALLKLNRMIDSPMREITDFALKEGVRLTQSTVGYLAFFNEDQTVLQMHSWIDSKEDGCTVKNRKTTYPLEETGLWGEAARQGKPIVTNDYSLPNPFKKGVPEGHIPLKRHMNIPVFDGDRIVAIAGVANKENDYEDSDVRQLNLLMEGMWMLLMQKRSRQQLQESEEKYRAIVDKSPVGVAIHVGGKLVFCNSKAREILDYSSADDLIGGDIAGLFHPDESRLFEERAPNSEINGYESDFEARMLCKGGAVKTAYVSSKSFRYDGGLAHMVTFLDITELKMAQDELEQAKNAIEKQNEELKKLDKIKDGLIRNVTHELRTPVAKQSMQIELLKGVMNGNGLEKETGKIIGVMESSVRRLENVIRNILELSRLEAGVKKCSMKRERLDSLIEDMLSEYQSIFEYEGIEVNADLHPIYIMTDREMIWHIFANILNNAVKFRSRHSAPRIDISIEDFEKHAELRITDNGIGLTEEEKPRVFEKLYKAEPSSEGSGVGLNIARLISQKIGADLWIESPGKNRGVTVGLRLPLSSE